MSDVITKQPNSSGGGNGGGQQQQEANGEGRQQQQQQQQQQPEPTLTGLGPLKGVDQVTVKQKIRLKDVCGEICGCEVSRIKQ